MKLVKDILILVVFMSTQFITQTVQGKIQYKPHSSSLYWSNLDVHTEFREKLVPKDEFDQYGSLDMNYFTRSKYQMKWNTTLSAKELVNTNLYKPTQVSGGKIVGELLLGSGASMVLGIAGAGLGYTVTYDPSGGSFLNFSGLGGAFVGYLVGSTMGSALGVYVIGSSGNETGSFGSTFLGSVLGTGLSIVIVLSSDYSEGINTTHFIVGSMIQSLGATIGFNLSIRKDDHSNPMVNLVSLNF